MRQLQLAALHINHQEGLLDAPPPSRPPSCFPEETFGSVFNVLKLLSVFCFPSSLRRRVEVDQQQVRCACVSLPFLAVRCAPT